MFYLFYLHFFELAEDFTCLKWFRKWSGGSYLLPLINTPLQVSQRHLETLQEEMGRCGDPLLKNKTRKQKNEKAGHKASRERGREKMRRLCVGDPSAQGK
jgi:hypothetical protein